MASEMFPQLRTFLGFGRKNQKSEFGSLRDSGFNLEFVGATVYFCFVREQRPAKWSASAMGTENLQEFAEGTKRQGG